MYAKAGFWKKISTFITFPQANSDLENVISFYYPFNNAINRTIYDERM
jgi:hypothetical protein